MIFKVKMYCFLNLVVGRKILLHITSTMFEFEKVGKRRTMQIYKMWIQYNPA
jgi:hypothetical protein